MRDLTGGCACDAVRYRIKGPVKFSFLCQCRDCQRMTGSGHAVQFAVATEDFEFTGPTHSWTRRTASGHEVSKHFCPTCGSPLFGQTSRAPATTMVMAGSLDDPSSLTPSRLFFADEAQPWDRPQMVKEEK